MKKGVILLCILLLIPATTAMPIPPWVDEDGNFDSTLSEDDRVDIRPSGSAGIGGVQELNYFKEECPLVFEKGDDGIKQFQFGEADTDGRPQPTGIPLKEIKPTVFQQDLGGSCGDDFLAKRPLGGVPHQQAKWQEPPDNLQRQEANANNLGIGVETNKEGQPQYTNPELKKAEDEGKVSSPIYPEKPIIQIINEITGEVTYEIDYKTTELKVLVIPVEFSDVAGESSIAELEALFFGETDSLAAYFDEQSYGALQLTGSIAPQWYTLPNTMGYYGGNYESNVGDMIEEAAEYADEDLDFSDYDSDGDGIVDSFFVVHAGDADESGGGNGDEIWSHYYSISAKTIDNVKVIDYETVSEFSPLGIIAHEFGHYLGLPDMYDTVLDDGSSKGTGEWSIMGYGGYLDEAGSFDPWSKAYLGWLNEESYIEIEETNQYEINFDNSLYGIKYYLLALSDTEHFWVENKDIKLMNRDDASGLLIWHIDEGIMEESGSWNGCTGTRWRCNTVNGNAEHKLIDVEEASGDQDLDGSKMGEAEDLWINDCGTFGGCQQNFFYSGSNPSSESYSTSSNNIVIGTYSEPGSTIQLMASLDGTILEDTSEETSASATVSEDGEEATDSPTTNSSSNTGISTTMIIIIILGAIILGAGGFIGYSLMGGKKKGVSPSTFKSFST